MQTLTRLDWLTAQPAGNGSYLCFSCIFLETERETRKTLRQDLERGISIDSIQYCVWFESIELQIYNLPPAAHECEEISIGAMRFGSTRLSDLGSQFSRLSIMFSGCSVLGTHLISQRVRGGICVRGLAWEEDSVPSAAVRWHCWVRADIKLEYRIYCLHFYRFFRLRFHFCFLVFFFLFFYNSFVGFFFIMIIIRYCCWPSRASVMGQVHTFWPICNEKIQVN